jgi:hypothetical protein
MVTPPALEGEVPVGVTDSTLWELSLLLSEELEELSDSSASAS